MDIKHCLGINMSIAKIIFVFNYKNKTRRIFLRVYCIKHPQNITGAGNDRDRNWSNKNCHHFGTHCTSTVCNYHYQPSEVFVFLKLAEQKSSIELGACCYQCLFAQYASIQNVNLERSTLTGVITSQVNAITIKRTCQFIK